MTKGYLLERMTWPQVKKAFEKTTFVVIPIGSTEQHGRHLPLGTDYLVAREIASRVMAAAKVIVTPTLPIGYSQYHTGFIGSLSIKEITLGQVLIDICENLVKYGTTHILFINGHGGNKGAINRCGEWLRERCIPMAAASYWDLSSQVSPQFPLEGHADFIEAAAVLGVDPSLPDLAETKWVQNNHLTPELFMEGRSLRFKNATIRVNAEVADVNSGGNMPVVGVGEFVEDYKLSPALATPEAGNTILNNIANYLVEFIEEFKKVEFPPLGVV